MHSPFPERPRVDTDPEASLSETGKSPPAQTQEEYWNTDGARRWLASMERTEALIAPIGTILLDRAAPAAGEHVLDVGCGGGATSREIAARVGPGGRVLGLDISAPILEAARARSADASNLEFRIGDAARMAWGGRTFDLICSRFGVMFFHEPVAAFANLRAALRPAGRMVFACWRALKENPWLDVPTEAAFRILPAPPPPEPDAPGPFALADPKRIESILAASGFSAIELTAVDGHFPLGDRRAWVEYFSGMGPVAAPLEQADETTRTAVKRAIDGALAPFETRGRLSAPYAIWLATARPR
jgi:SAM-dependent methyltransferase